MRLWDLGTPWMWEKVKEEMRRYPRPGNQEMLTDTEQGEKAHWC